MYICNMKGKIHEFDIVGAIYEVKCLKHNDYNGETNQALKERAYEHKVISRKESIGSHTLKENKKDEEEE